MALRSAAFSRSKENAGQKRHWTGTIQLQPSCRHFHGSRRTFPNFTHITEQTSTSLHSLPADILLLPAQGRARHFSSATKREGTPKSTCSDSGSAGTPLPREVRGDPALSRVCRLCWLPRKHRKYVTLKVISARHRRSGRWEVPSTPHSEQSAYEHFFPLEMYSPRLAIKKEKSVIHQKDKQTNKSPNDFHAVSAQLLSKGYFCLWKFNTHSSNSPKITHGISSLSLLPFLQLCVTSQWLLAAAPLQWTRQTPRGLPGSEPSPQAPPSPLARL